MLLAAMAEYGFAQCPKCKEATELKLRIDALGEVRALVGDFDADVASLVSEARAAHEELAQQNDDAAGVATRMARERKPRAGDLEPCCSWSGRVPSPLSTDALALSAWQ